MDGRVGEAVAGCDAVVFAAGVMSGPASAGYFGDWLSLRLWGNWWDEASRPANAFWGNLAGFGLPLLPIHLKAPNTNSYRPQSDDPAGAIAVFPSPGCDAASPRTEISFRGELPDDRCTPPLSSPLAATWPTPARTSREGATRVETGQEGWIRRIDVQEQP